jgi:hypothetical protein
MFVALGIQRAMRISHFVTCGLPGPKRLFHIISRKERFSKTKAWNMKDVF